MAAKGARGMYGTDHSACGMYHASETQPAPPLLLVRSRIPRSSRSAPVRSAGPAPLLAHLPCIRAGGNEAVRFQNGQPMSVDLLSVTAPRPNRA